MKNLSKMLLALCLLLQLSFVTAETTKTFNYENQREEIFDLENWLKETQYKMEEVKDTCHRDVPYEEKVCKDVTKYKNECRTIPSHTECANVNKPICHNETRTREVCRTPTHRECHTENSPECHLETRYENRCTTIPGEQQCRVVIRYHEECENVPGSRQCRQVPPDIQCRVINGENKCEKIPGHEECTDSGSRRECRRVPYEERECSTGPSHERCEQIPHQEEVCKNNTRQVCEDVEDEEICRDISYEEKICVDHIERICQTVPTKDECVSVPYKENVCSMETRHKDETYECTKKVKVPVEVIVKTHKARVQMDFNALAKNSNSRFKVQLGTDGKLDLAAKELENANLLIFAKKDIKANEQADINSIDAIFKIVIMDKNEYFKFMKTGIRNVVLEPRRLSFSIDGKIEIKRANLLIKISKNDEVKIDAKVLGPDLKSEFDGEKTLISVDLKKLDAPKLGGVFNREHNTKLKLILNYSDLGESLILKEKEFSTSVNVDIKVQ